MTVIEELTITMDPERIDAFLRRDASVWTEFLRRCEGFEGKEVWLPTDRPDTVVLIIRWQSEAHWKGITDEEIEQVDAEMGDLAASELACRSYEVGRQTR